MLKGMFRKNSIVRPIENITRESLFGEIGNKDLIVWKNADCKVLDIFLEWGKVLIDTPTGYSIMVEFHKVKLVE